MKPRFTVSILTYTALPQAKRCIASVLKSTLPFELILTANGNAEAGDYFEELKAEYGNIRVVHNSTNQGFIEPNRFAFGLCETEYFVMLNDDAVVPANWLFLLEYQFDIDNRVAIVGPYGQCSELDDKFIGRRGIKLDYIEGSCLMIRRSLVEKIGGLFSDYIEFANCEDADLSLRAQEAGFIINKADFVLTHEVGATRKHVPGLAAIFQKNLAACQVRWADYLKSKDRKFPCEK